QIFYNFIDNSIKHGKKVTQIKFYYTKYKDQIKLYYEDNGIGVSQENKPRLFTEGFTTGDGTGLGLAIMKKIMDVYGWKIDELGKPGKGAKFEIIIPK
ncbi:MAG: ATP-binding protein, partial [Crenarchaeota archaeon]|nr:ATP-binding protein [Thermoproteota archaeon]